MAEADAELVDVNLDEDTDDKKGSTNKNGTAVEVVEEKKAKAKGEERKGPSQEDVAAKLKKDLADEKAGRIEAEARAKEASKKAEEAVAEVGTTQLQLVTNAIASLRNDTKTLKSDYSAALKGGDYDAAAEIQEKMADNAAKLLQLENGKSAMEDDAKRAKEAPKKIEVSDPVESLAQQLTPSSAAWVRAHPEFARNPRKYQAMVGAHNAVMGSDDPPEPDSDDYFSRVEGILGVNRRQAEETDDDADDDGVSAMSEAAKTAKRRDSAPPAAPVSNSGTGSGERQGRATLTKAEAEIAESLGMSNKEYYENKQALKKQGRLN